jgi:hypothetical protein
LQIQSRSKRAKFDATQHYWRVAMLCTLATCVLWFAAAKSCRLLAEHQEWSLLCGVLALFGGFLSVMIGMLYKIVPFLVWLHLQNRGAWTSIGTDNEQGHCHTTDRPADVRAPPGASLAAGRSRSGRCGSPIRPD